MFINASDMKPQEPDSGRRWYQGPCNNALAAALAIVLVLGASLALRLYPTLADPDTKKMLSLPVLAEFDGYYYLRYAKQYCAGTYTAGDVDTLRGVHNDIKRPPLPLLSAVACYAGRATGAAMEHVALFLPMVFSAFVAIPLWLYRKQTGGELVAAVAITFTLTSPIFILRTKAGFFDTDCLNVFFMLTVLWLLQKAAETRHWRGVAYAALGAAAFKLFMLWYNKPGLYYLFAGMLALLLVLYREGNGFRMAGLKLLLFAVIGVPLVAFNPVAWVQAYFSTNILKVGTIEGFPNVATSVGELVQPSLWVSLTLVHQAAFVIAGILGLLWLAASRRRDVVSLFPLLAIGAVGLWSGMRYLIYLAPVVGIGLGFLAVRGAESIAGKLKTPGLPGMVIFTAAMTAAFAVAVSSPREHHGHRPIFNVEGVQGILSLRHLEPGLVWNWWDQGYPIQELAGQSTYVDNGRNNNAYYVALSFMQHDQRHTRNIIRNVLNAQTKPGPLWNETDIEKLRAEPEAGGPDTPVYLALTSDLIDKHRWIYYYGNWDFKTASGDSSAKLWYMGSVDNSLPHDAFETHTGNTVDLRRGLAYLNGQMVLLSGVHRVSDGNPGGQKFQPLRFAGESSLLLELVRHPYRTDVFLVEKDFYDTQLNSMFILGEYDPSLFELVYSNEKMARIYRLR